MFCLFVSGLEDSSAFYIFFFIFFSLLSDYSLALLADYSWTGHGQGKHCIGSVCDLCRHFPNSGRINCYLIVRRHITTTSVRPSSIIMNAQPIRSTATTLPVISLVKKKDPQHIAGPSFSLHRLSTKRCHDFSWPIRLLVQTIKAPGKFSIFLCA